MRSFFRSRIVDDKTAKLAAIDKVQATVEFRSNGTILAANQKFLQAMGYTMEEIRG